MTEADHGANRPEQGSGAVATEGTPGYPDGWDPLADGPLDGDELGAALWRDWHNAEGDGNEWAAKWAWDRYVRWMTGEPAVPTATGPIGRRPFIEVLAAIRERAAAAGDLELVARVDNAIDAEAEAGPPPRTPDQKCVTDVHEAHRRRWRHVRARTLWWLRYYLDVGWVPLCSTCVERDRAGDVPRADFLQPVGDRSVRDLVDQCHTCGRKP